MVLMSWPMFYDGLLRCTRWGLGGFRCLVWGLEADQEKLNVE